MHLKDSDRIYPSYRYSHGTLALRPSNPLLRLVSQLVKVEYSPKNNWTIYWNVIHRRNKCLVSGPSTASVAGVRKYVTVFGTDYLLSPLFQNLWKFYNYNTFRRAQTLTSADVQHSSIKQPFYVTNV